jgi:hypothetical protein
MENEEIIKTSDNTSENWDDEYTDYEIQKIKSNLYDKLKFQTVVSV